MFIVFEGIDRSGKSSQVKLLAEKIPNSKVVCFPCRTTRTGQLIDDYLTGKYDIDAETAQLLFSANRREMQLEITKMLEENIVIICDRYNLSSIAYGGANGINPEWAKEIDRGIIQPDITFFMNIDPEVSAMRGNFGNERYENVVFQRKVAANFEECVGGFGSNIVRIDASKSVADIHKLVLGWTSSFSQ